MIEDVGGADVCYGGIGWCGHIAFWEADLGHEFGDDLEAYKQAGPRIVELTPMTIMQNALHSFGGDWSWVPPKAATHRPGARSSGAASQLLAGRLSGRRRELAALHRPAVAHGRCPRSCPARCCRPRRATTPSSAPSPTTSRSTWPSSSISRRHRYTAGAMSRTVVAALGALLSFALVLPASAPGVAAKEPASGARSAR